VTAPTGTCDRFDAGELLRQERGEPPDPHLASCAECQQRLARTEGLRRVLGQIPIEKSTSNWEQAVWGKIAAGRARRRRLWVGLPVLLAAAGVLLLIRSPGPSPVPVTGTAPLLALAFEAGPERLRSGGPAVGSTVVVDGSAVVLEHAELRIYRDDAGLLLRCSNEPPCHRHDGRLGARFTIPSIGRYRVLLLQAPAPLPAPTDGYDRDLAAVTRVQSSVHVEQTFEVY
jgi:hypothetical protein